MKKVQQFFSDESGATAIEYGLIAAGISVAIVAIVGVIGGELENTFNTIASSLQNTASGS